MKKAMSILFAFAMILSITFIGSAVSSNGSMSAQAQVAAKRKSGGVVGGAKYIYRKSKNGTVYIYRKTKSGTVYVGKKTYQGGKYVGKKTVKGTKYVGKKTVNGTKTVFSKTKKVIVGDN